jgi:hypothetical protein
MGNKVKRCIVLTLLVKVKFCMSRVLDCVSGSFYDASPSAARCCLLAFLAALAAAAFAFLASARATLSSSSFRFASSSAFRLSSSALALASAADIPPLFFFFASRASFSSCLILLIRGSKLSVRSTRLRNRAVSSFFRRARSVLFFFSVYRLSSRLYPNPVCQPLATTRGKRKRGGKETTTNLSLPSFTSLSRYSNDRQLSKVYQKS